MSRRGPNFIPFLAGSLCVTVLAGCPNAGTQPPVNGVPSTAPTASTGTGALSTSTPGSTAGGSASPTTTGTPSGSSSSDTGASTAASAPSAPGVTTILQGDVYDEALASVDGATVTVRSLDASHPYNATLATAQGHYVTNNVPVGVQIQVSVTKSGWTTRTRVASFQENSDLRNTMNFGGPSTTTSSADPSGPAYFVSDYPEISGTIPDSDTLNGKHLGYKIRMSEALDSQNQARLVSAMLFSADPAPGSATPIIINNSSSFLQTNRTVSTSWNADGTELTVTFEAPLRRLDNDIKTYALSVVRPAGADLITDKSNKVLGFTAPGAAQQYAGAIKLASLTLTGNETSAAQRWASTHTRASGFDLVKDDARPILTAVSGGSITTSAGDKERIELTFNKPVLVYPDVTQADGTLAGSDPSVIDPSKYGFAISDKSVTGTDMSKLDLAGHRVLTNTTTLADVQALENSTTPFTMDSNVITGIHVSTNNPNVVQIDVKKSIWPTDAKFIRVRVDSTWKDPSGNLMSQSNTTADFTGDNVKDGNLF